MAIRPCFIPAPQKTPVFSELPVEFRYYTGFAHSQKQRSIKSMHEQIFRISDTLKVLEISTKSDNPIGVALSAFNLKLCVDDTGREFSVENVFQSSKAFEKAGPFRDLLFAQPKDAKRDERLRNSGALVSFKLGNTSWPLEPRTMFYDWLYIKALMQNQKLAKSILDFNAFTDIEFNPKKSINCQARSAAIYVSLFERGEIELALRDPNILKRAYEPNSGSQPSLF